MEIRSPRVECVSPCLTYSIYIATGGRRTGFSRPSSNERCGCGGNGRPMDARPSSKVARWCTHNRGLARPGQGYPTPSSKGEVLVSRLDSLGLSCRGTAPLFARPPRTRETFHAYLGHLSLGRRRGFALHLTYEPCRLCFVCISIKR